MGMFVGSTNGCTSCYGGTRIPCSCALVLDDTMTITKFCNSRKVQFGARKRMA